MPRKRSVQEIAQSDKESAGRSAPRRAQTGSRRKIETTARKDRSTAATKGGAKGQARRGTQRASAAEIVARNAEIVRLREIERMMWEDIAARFGVDEKTVKRGYDAHVEGRQHEVNFEQAMKDMREYVAVLDRNQYALAQIAHELEEREIQSPDGKTVTTEKVRQDVRARIAAMHEMVEQMFKQIAMRQAIGDLPVRFAEMAAAKDLEWSIEEIMAVLQEYKVPHKVFLEIAKRVEGSDVKIPKTHLASVGSKP